MCYKSARAGFPESGEYVKQLAQPCVCVEGGGRRLLASCTRGAGRTPKGSQELRPAMRACLATPRTRTRIYHMMHAAASDSASGLDHYIPKDPPERIIWIISKRIPSSRNGENFPQKSFLEWRLLARCEAPGKDFHGKICVSLGKYGYFYVKMIIFPTGSAGDLGGGVKYM